MQHAREAMVLSKKLNYPKGVAKATVIIGGVFLELGKYAEAMEYLRKGIELCDKSGDKHGKAKALYYTGHIYRNQFNYYTAVKKYTEALNLFKEIGDLTNVAISYYELGKVYSYVGNSPEALKNHYAALKIYEKQNFANGMMAVNINIAIHYSEQGNLDESLKLEFITLGIAQKANSKKVVGITYNNIGEIYFKKNNYPQALRYYRASLEICRETKDGEGEAVAYGNIGNIYEQQFLYTEAMAMYMHSLKVAEEAGDEEELIEANTNIAKVYIWKKDYSKSEMHLEMALKKAMEIGKVAEIKGCYEELTRLYKLQNKAKQTFESYSQYIIYSDSLYNEENTKRVTQVQMQYEFDKKVAADSIKNMQEQKLKDSEINAKIAIIEKGKTQFWLVVGGLVLVALALIIVINRFRLTNKQKNIIERQNFQIIESINYSRKIQDSILPNLKEMQEHIDNLFVFYKPKDIVSGDFYWYKQFDKCTLLACVDCTGHGVPGAFMSTLGSLLLDKLVLDGEFKPSEILNKLNSEIIRILHQQSGGAIQDGMDISICLIDKHNKKISFSGARNGIVIVKDQIAQRYKASNLSVGGNYRKDGKAVERNFETIEIPVATGDWVYMYTDGFIEQLGGAEGRPMNHQQFEHTLSLISTNENPEEKCKALQTTLDAWRGHNTRTDDVLVIGFQLSDD